MNPRLFFFLTAISGMIGMVALIAASIFKRKIIRSFSSPDWLHHQSQQTIDNAWRLALSNNIAVISIISFIIFAVFYFASRSRP